jgi:hypothetical protein
MKPTEEELAAQVENEDRRLARVVEDTVNERFRQLSEKLDRALQSIESKANE